MRVYRCNPVRVFLGLELTGRHTLFPSLCDCAAGAAVAGAAFRGPSIPLIRAFRPSFALAVRVDRQLRV